jgi:TRAP-type C4-dicarboxylate transport system permease small subunit
MFSPAWRDRLGALTSLCGLGVSLVLLIWGANATWLAWVRGSYKPTVIEFPAWIVLIVIPVGSLFLALRFVRQLVGHLRGSGNDEAPFESGL